MFDCVLPTRLGRTGTIYTREGKVDVRKSALANNPSPFSTAPGLEKFSYGYLNHLFRSGEMLGPLLASMHNIHFIVGLVRDIRTSIIDGSFGRFRSDFLKRYTA